MAGSVAVRAASCKALASGLADAARLTRTPLSSLLAQRLNEHQSNSWRRSFGIYKTCSNEEEYARLAVARYFAFGALERAFAMQPRASPLACMWVACPELHGATRKLEYDLRAVGICGITSTPSSATAAYVANLDEVAEDGTSLLGHFYGHYVANILEAPAQGRQVQLALGLAPGTPEIYRLPESVEEDRAAYQKTVCTMLDAVSNSFSADERRRTIEGAGEALDFLAEVHSEGRENLATSTALGAARVASGYVSEKLFRGSAEVQVENMQLLMPHTRRVVTPGPDA